MFDWAPGRHQPMCHPCKMQHYYVQRHKTSLMYPWRASSLLKVLLPKVCYGLSVGCRLCGILPVQGKEFHVGFALYISCWVLWGLFLLLIHKNVFLPSQVELE